MYRIQSQNNRRDSTRQWLFCCSRSFEVTHISINRKHVCDLLLVRSTNLHLILHCCPVIGYRAVFLRLSPFTWVVPLLNALILAVTFANIAIDHKLLE